MTSRTWIGGGNNNASGANHWSPDGMPQPGDTLEMLTGTMNIRGNDLAGDALLINKPYGETAPTTLNLSHHANVSVEIPQNQTEQVTINVKGSDTLNLQNDHPSSGGFFVNLADHASLTGNVRMTFVSAIFNGGEGSRYLNNGNSILQGSSATFNMSVKGNGSFSVQSAQSFGGQLEFGGSVSYGQAVDVRGDAERLRISHVQIDQPHAFKGSIGLGINGQIDLIGLANADSFQLKNDVLSIYSGCEVIDRLRLTTPAPPPFSSGPDAAITGITVHQTSAGVVVARGLSFITGTDTVLPEHQLHGWGTVPA